MANVPAWKNTDCLISSGYSPYTYSINLKTGNQITVNGVATEEIITVFSGKAWVRPGEGYIKININRIAQNYLYSDLPDLNSVTGTVTYENKYAYRDFYLVNSANTTVSAYTFLLDYSYEDVDFSTTHSMSEPINGHGMPGMLFLSTQFNASSHKVITTVSVSAGSSYDTTHCGQYALYYLNVHGGWDSFLIEGNVTRNDVYTKYQMNHSFDNTTLEFQKRTYNNEITTNYELHTGWLSDTEAEILSRNLVPSNMMYLHDLVNDKIYPVNCKDNNAIYKTFKNQGHKRFNYTINVECAQNKLNIG